MNANGDLSSLRTFRKFIEDINAVRNSRDREDLVHDIYDACLNEQITPGEARLLMQTVQKVAAGGSSEEEERILAALPSGLRKRRERESGSMKDFYSVHGLADYFGYNPCTVSKKVSEMRKHPERYTRDDIFTSGKYTYVSSGAFVDWLKWGDDIQNGFTDIPAYDPGGSGRPYQTGRVRTVG